MTEHLQFDVIIPMLQSMRNRSIKSIKKIKKGNSGYITITTHPYANIVFFGEEVGIKTQKSGHLLKKDKRLTIREIYWDYEEKNLYIEVLEQENIKNVWTNGIIWNIVIDMFNRVKFTIDFK